MFLRIKWKEKEDDTLVSCRAFINLYVTGLVLFQCFTEAHTLQVHLVQQKVHLDSCLDENNGRLFLLEASRKLLEADFRRPFTDV